MGQWLEFLGMDVEPIIELGNQWIAMGDSLEERILTLTDAVHQDMVWDGAAAASAKYVFDAGIVGQLHSARDSAYQIGGAINYYAEQLIEANHKAKQELLKNIILEMFGFLTGFLSLFLPGILAGLFGALAKELTKVISVVDQFLSEMGRLGTLIGYTGVAVTGAAVQLGVDVLGEAIGDAATGLPFHIDWKSEGINMAAAAGGGVIFHGFESLGPKLASKLDGNVHTPSTGGPALGSNAPKVDPEAITGPGHGVSVPPPKVGVDGAHGDSYVAPGKSPNDVGNVHTVTSKIDPVADPGNHTNAPANPHTTNSNSERVAGVDSAAPPPQAGRSSAAGRNTVPHGRGGPGGEDVRPDLSGGHGPARQSVVDNGGRDAAPSPGRGLPDANAPVARPASPGDRSAVGNPPNSRNDRTVDTHQTDNAPPVTQPGQGDGKTFVPGGRGSDGNSPERDANFTGGRATPEPGAPGSGKSSAHGPTTSGNGSTLPPGRSTSTDHVVAPGEGGTSRTTAGNTPGSGGRTSAPASRGGESSVETVAGGGNRPGSGETGRPGDTRDGSGAGETPVSDVPGSGGRVPASPEGNRLFVGRNDNRSGSVGGNGRELPSRTPEQVGETARGIAREGGLSEGEAAGPGRGDPPARPPSRTPGQGGPAGGRGSTGADERADAGAGPPDDGPGKGPLGTRDQEGVAVQDEGTPGAPGDRADAGGHGGVRGDGHPEAVPSHEGSPATPHSADDPVRGAVFDPKAHYGAEAYQSRKRDWQAYKHARDAEYKDWLAMVKRLESETRHLNLDDEMAAANAKFGQEDLFGGRYLGEGDSVVGWVGKAFRKDLLRGFERWEKTKGDPEADDGWSQEFTRIRERLPDWYAQLAERTRRTRHFDASFDRALEQFRKDDPFGGAYLGERKADRSIGYDKDSDTFVVMRYDEASHKWVVDHDADGLNQIRAKGYTDVVKAVDSAWRDGRPDEQHARALETTLAKLHSELPARLDQESQIQRSQPAFDREYARWSRWAGRRLGEETLGRVRREFTDDLRRVYDDLGAQAAEHPDGWFGPAWEGAEEHLVNVLNPYRFEHGELRERALKDGERALQAAIAAHNDAWEGRRWAALGEGGKERLSTEWNKALESAVDEHWSTLSGRDFRRPRPLDDDGGDTAQGPRTSWDERFRDLTDTLPHRVSHESEKANVLRGAADDFGRIAGHTDSMKDGFEVSSESFDELADGFRNETITEYDRIWGPKGSDSKAWLTREANHEGVFGARLTAARKAPLHPAVRAPHRSTGEPEETATGDSAEPKPGGGDEEVRPAPAPGDRSASDAPPPARSDEPAAPGSEQLQDQVVRERPVPVPSRAEVVRERPLPSLAGRSSTAQNENLGAQRARDPLLADQLREQEPVSTPEKGVSPAVTTRFAEALADVGRAAAVRDEAYQAFDAQLETYPQPRPQPNTRPAERLLEPVRQWFADRWTAAGEAGASDYQVTLTRDQLKTELADRLSPQAMRQQQKPPEPHGASAAKRTYEREFAEALRFEGKWGYQKDFARPEYTWDRWATQYYANRLAELQQQYAQDRAVSEALGQGADAEVDRLMQGVLQAALRLRAQTEPMTEAVRDFHERSLELRTRDGELLQDTDLRIWYWKHQSDVVQRFAGALKGQGLGATERLKRDFGQQIQALRDVARTRLPASQEFRRLQNEAGLRGWSSLDTSRWANEQVRPLREEFIQAYAASAGEEHSLTPPSSATRAGTDWRTAASRADRERLDATYADILAQAEVRGPELAQGQETSDAPGRPGAAPVTATDPRPSAEYRARLDEAFGQAATSFRDEVDEAGRTLLDAFGARDAELSAATLSAVWERLGGELEAAFAEEFRPTDPAATQPASSDRWNARFDALVGRLPGELAAAAAREAAVARAREAVDAAVRAWPETSSGLSATFLRRFGRQPGRLRADVHEAVRSAFADSTKDRFDQSFDGISARNLPARLQEWERTVTAWTDRLPTWLTLEAARRAASVDARRTFEERLDSLDPGHTLSADQVWRLRSSFDARAQTAFVTVFTGSTGEPADMTTRAWAWEARLADLTKALPDHVSFESAAAAGLRDAAASFHRLSQDSDIDAGRLKELAAEYRADWFGAFRALWAPADLHRSWLAHEEFSGDAFAGALADLRATGEQRQSTEEKAAGTTPAEETSEAAPRARRDPVWLPPGRGRAPADLSEAAGEASTGGRQSSAAADVVADGLIEGDYRLDYPAAYRETERSFARLGNVLLSSVRSGARAAALDHFVNSRMEVHFQAALRHAGITALSMPPNGDCFFETFLSEEAPAAVRQRLRDILGTEPTVAGIRAYMADFLAAEFARLNRDPQAETVAAPFFPVADAADHASRRRRQDTFVRDIRTMGSYDNEASDRVPHMFSAIFGIPIDLWQPRYRTPIGWTREDQAVVPVTVIRQGAHYYYARTGDGREPTLTPPVGRPAEMPRLGTSSAGPSRGTKRPLEDEAASAEPATKRVRRDTDDAMDVAMDGDAVPVHGMADLSLDDAMNVDPAELDLGDNVRTNALFAQRMRAPSLMTDVQYRRFLEQNIDNDRPLSFVVNIILPAKAIGRIPEIVDAVMRGFDGDTSRVGFVFGVNKKDRGADLPRAVVDQIEEVLGSLEYPAAVVGTTFTGKFQPGAMRNTVLDSAATQALLSGFLEAGTYPYISIQDFDDGERTVTSGRHVFDHFADKLHISDHIAPLRPMMIAGGYRTDPGVKFKAGLSDAILEDMQVRDRLAGVHPLLPYAPEPNLFLDGTLLLREDNDIRFGEGAAEFGKMAEALNTAYAAELSLGFTSLEPARTAAANNAHPLRGQAFVTDFTDGATVTELTRFGKKFTGTRGTLPQNHVTLGGVRNQFYISRDLQKGTSFASYRTNRLARYQEREPFRARHPNMRYTMLPMGQRWVPLDTAEEKALNADPDAELSKKTPGGKDRKHILVRKGVLNTRISTPLSDGLHEGERRPEVTPRAAAGVQPDEGVLAAHLTAVSDQTSTLLSQFAAVQDQILAGDPPLVARGSLFDAVQRAIGAPDAESLRAAVIETARAEVVRVGQQRDLSKQPIVRQAVTRPFGVGDLVNAFVEHRVVSHVPVPDHASTRWEGAAERLDNERADNARDMVGRAVATHLRTTVVLHLPDGQTIRLEPFELEPFERPATRTVDIDLHVDDGRQIFTPHGELPPHIAKSKAVAAQDESRDDDVDMEAGQEWLPDVEVLSSAAEALLGDAGAAGVSTYRSLLAHARAVLAGVPVNVRTELLARASERAGSVHWTPPVDKTGMPPKQVDMAKVVEGVLWIMVAHRYLDRGRPDPWQTAEDLSSHLADDLGTRGEGNRTSPGRGRQTVEVLEIEDGGAPSSVTIEQLLSRADADASEANAELDRALSGDLVGEPAVRRAQEILDELSPEDSAHAWDEAGTIVRETAGLPGSGEVGGIVAYLNEVFRPRLLIAAGVAVDGPEVARDLARTLAEYAALESAAEADASGRRSLAAEAPGFLLQAAVHRAQAALRELGDPPSVVSSTASAEEILEHLGLSPDQVTDAERTLAHVGNADGLVADFTDLDGARLVLGKQSGSRYAEVMDQARTIVHDLSGLLPSQSDLGQTVSDVDRVRILVAAHIVRAGVEGVEDIARSLLSAMSASVPSRWAADLTAMVNLAVIHQYGDLVPVFTGEQVVTAYHKLPDQARIDPMPQVAGRVMEQLTVGAVVRTLGGAIGAEFETVIKLHADAELHYATMLAENEALGFRLVVDHRNFYIDAEGTYYPTKALFDASKKTLRERQDKVPVVEFVTRPGGVPGESKKWTIQQIIGGIREALTELSGKSQNGPLSIADWLPESSGWTDRRADVKADIVPIYIGPDRDITLYAQYTVDIRPAELYGALQEVLKNSQEGTNAARFLKQGLEFGTEIAKDFAGELAQAELPASAVDVLDEIESIAAVRGFMALVYPHIAANLWQLAVQGKNYTKNWVLAASRTALAPIRELLSDDARKFLEDHAEHIGKTLVEKFRAGSSDFDAKVGERGINPEEILAQPLASGDGQTIGAYLGNALLPLQGEIVDQYQGIGIVTNFRTTRDGQAVVEFRGWGPYPIGIGQVPGVIEPLGNMLADREQRAHWKQEQPVARRRELVQAARLLTNPETDTRAAAFKAFSDEFDRLKPIWRSRHSDSDTDLLPAADVATILLGLRALGVAEPTSPQAVAEAIETLRQLTDRLNLIAEKNSQRIQEWAGSAFEKLEAVGAFLLAYVPSAAEEAHVDSGDSAHDVEMDLAHDVEMDLGAAEQPAPWEFPADFDFDFEVWVAQAAGWLGGLPEEHRQKMLRQADRIASHHHEPLPVDLTTAPPGLREGYVGIIQVIATQLGTLGLDAAWRMSSGLADQLGTRRRTGGAPPGHFRPPVDLLEIGGGGEPSSVTLDDLPPSPATEQPDVLARARPLSAVVPEELWWRLYLDPRDHVTAVRRLPADPGFLYDTEESPGFKKSMVGAYRAILDAPVAQRLNSAIYKQMHEIVTANLNEKFDWSGKQSNGFAPPTEFPLRNERPHPEVLIEMVGDRPLLVDPVAYMKSNPGRPKPDPVAIVNNFKLSNVIIQTVYAQSQVPGLVDTVLDRYYDEIGQATTDHDRLRAMGRVVRALQIIHPFGDANRRLNVHLLLPKLLLEQGFQPVVRPDMAMLFQGGYSADEIAAALLEGQQDDLAAPIEVPPEEGTAEVDESVEFRDWAWSFLAGAGPVLDEPMSELADALHTYEEIVDAEIAADDPEYMAALERFVTAAAVVTGQVAEGQENDEAYGDLPPDEVTAPAEHGLAERGLAEHVATPAQGAQVVLDAALDLVGSLRWRGASSPDPASSWSVGELTRWGHLNHFALWIRGTGPEPNAWSTMNCWEVVLFAAYRAGVVDKAWLDRIHAEASEAAVAALAEHENSNSRDVLGGVRVARDAYGQLASVGEVAYDATLLRSFYQGELTEYPVGAENAPVIPAGDLIFFNGSNHVGLSLGTRDDEGRQQMLSLWAFPAHRPAGPYNTASTYGVLQVTSVEELVEVAGMYSDKVEFARPVWATPAATVDADTGNADDQDSPAGQEAAPPAGERRSVVPDAFLDSVPRTDSATARNGAAEAGPVESGDLAAEAPEAPGHEPETLPSYIDAPASPESVSAMAARLGVGFEQAERLSRYSWFDAERFESVRDQLGADEAPQLAFLVERIGRIPDDMEEVADRLAPLGVRDVYWLSREFVVDPRHLELFGDRLREVSSLSNAQGPGLVRELRADLQARYAPADEIVAFGETRAGRPRAGGPVVNSGATRHSAPPDRVRSQATFAVEDDGPSRPTDAQAVRLARLALRPSHVGGLIPALVELAPTETSMASPGAAPTPEQVRAYLADALARDLDRPEAHRRRWPLLEADVSRLDASLRPAPEPRTDAARRALIELLRTPDGRDYRSDVIAALAAGRVFGLALTLVLPDGGLAEIGSSPGRSVVLAKLPRAGDWVGAVPVTVPTGPEAGGVTPGPDTTHRRRTVPTVFFDAPRPARLD